MEEIALTKKCIVIGGSAGSLQAILYLLSNLSATFSIPVIITLHRKNDHHSELIEVLRYRTGLVVKEVEDKEAIQSGTVYIAPADYHLMIEKNHTFSLDSSEKVHFSRPSIDVTFQTAADTYGHGLIAILLSGANADGTDGLREVRKNQGLLIVQDPADATTPFMPQNAIDHKLADRILNTVNITNFLNLLA
jgi:two-component system chemotaxis response regulator CheB